MQTDYEAIVIGGNFAGLSAAMMLARARRRVLVLDSGKPRNRFAHASHGFLGQDGRTPEEIGDIGRTQLLAYPTVSFQAVEAVSAAVVDGVFKIGLADGNAVTAQRLVLATGLKDHLPDIPGMKELWGAGVNQCPYCHGYEVADRKIAVFGTGDWAVHLVRLLRDWSSDVTLLTHGGTWLTAEHRTDLAALGIGLDETPVARLIPSAEKWKERELAAVEFANGRTVPYGALFTAPTTTFASPLAEQLGCEVDETPFGTRLRTDAAKETTVPGVFAAGDATLPMANATFASADGVLAGSSAHRSLNGEAVRRDLNRAKTESKAQG